MLPRVNRYHGSRSLKVRRLFIHHFPNLSVLVLVFLRLLVPCASVFASSHGSLSLEITVGESTVFEVPGLETVAIGDETVADVVVSGEDELLLNGKKPGTTTLLIWSKTKRESWTVTVLPHQRPSSEVLRTILGTDVSYTWLKTTLLLTGQVTSAEEKVRIETAILEIWPDTVSALTVNSDVQAEKWKQGEAAMAASIRKLYPNIQLRQSQGILVIEGEVPNAEDIDELRDLATKLGFIPIVNVAVAESYWQEAVKLPVKLGLSQAWVQKVNDLLILRGQVASDIEAEALEAAVSQYGETINLLSITHETKPQTVNLSVASADVDAEVLTQLRELVGNENIDVRLVNGHVLLTGEVTREEEAVIAEKIASLFSERVVNCLTFSASGSGMSSEYMQVSPDLHVSEQRQVEEKVREHLTSYGVEIKALSDEIVLVSGKISQENSGSIRKILDRVYPNWIDDLVVVDDLVSSKRKLEFLMSRAPSGVQIDLLDDRLLLSGSCSQQEKQIIEMQAAALWPEIVSTIVPAEDTRAIQIHVRILEINEDSLTELGVDVSAIGQHVFEKPEFSTSSGALRFMLSPLEETELLVRLDAMASEGKVRTLAAPNLVVTSGKRASFLAGGEIPLPVKSDEEVSIDWREYGVKLNVSAAILSDQIRVDLEPEVSLLDWSNKVTIEDVDIPAIRTRKASTSVYLSDGDSIVIGGLLGEEERRTIAKLPVLGDLPIIGALFRSERYQSSRSDLVVILTPKIGLPENAVLLEGSMWQRQEK